MPVDTKKFPYEVKIPFRYGDSISSWDKFCVECVEKYGLPGDKYVAYATADFMNFYFINEKDAIWFRLASE